MSIEELVERNKQRLLKEAFVHARNRAEGEGENMCIWTGVRVFEFVVGVVPEAEGKPEWASELYRTVQPITEVL